MSLATPIPSGIYYISSQISSTSITAVNAVEGTNVTAWTFDGTAHQQWKVSNNGAQYTIQNVEFGTYISSGTTAPTTNGAVLVGSLSPSPWNILQYKDGFMVASPTFPDYTFNLAGAGYGNATPVLIYPFTIISGPDNQVWYFNSTMPTTLTTTTTTPAITSSTPPSASAISKPQVRHSPPGGAIGGIVFVAIAIVLLLVCLAFFEGKRRGGAAVRRSNGTRRLPERHTPPENGPTRSFTLRAFDTFPRDSALGSTSLHTSPRSSAAGSSVLKSPQLLNDHATSLPDYSFRDS